MTAVYRLFREHPSRLPSKPCELSPPLRLEWTHQYQHIPAALPLIEHGLVFVGRPDGALAALCEETGEPLWIRPNCGEPSFIHDGTLFIYNRENEIDCIESTNGALTRTMSSKTAMKGCVVGDRILGHGYQFEKEFFFSAERDTGTVLWEFEIPKGIFVKTTFCASDAAVFFGLDDGSLIGLSIEDGKQIWQQSLAHLTWDDLGKTKHGRPQGVATLWRDRAIVDTRSHVSAFACDTGNLLWTTDVSFVGSGYLYDNLYYTVGGFVIDPADGKILHFHTLYRNLPRKLQESALTPPLLVSETHIFTTTLHGHILAFDRFTGQFDSYFRPKGWGTIQMHHYFMSVNRRFYYADLSMRLYCLKEASGPKN